MKNIESRPNIRLGLTSALLATTLLLGGCSYGKKKDSGAGKTETAPQTSSNLYPNPAKHEGTSWTLPNSDGVETKIDLATVVGFTPDAKLNVSDIKPKELGVAPSNSGDFQAYLNKPNNNFAPLAGFTDGTNDYNQYDKQSSMPQVPIYSWMVHTGLNINMAGIGSIVGGEGRASMILILNRTPRVYQFPIDSVQVKAGFQGWGRIWDGGNTETVKETEKRLVNHFLTRLGKGVPETGFVGQSDLVDNSKTVTVVTVERIQWGNNPDGTPRDQFRLIRAATVPAVKK